MKVSSNTGNDSILSDRVLFSNEYDESAEVRTQSWGPRTFYIDKTAFYVFGAHYRSRLSLLSDGWLMERLG